MVHQVTKTLERLKEMEHKVFHTEMGKLLLLAKRVHLDILTVVKFCAPCYCRGSEEVSSCFGLLKGMSMQSLVIQPVNNLQLHTYIDAAFALQNDSKSHTGVVSMLDNSML